MAEACRDKDERRIVEFLAAAEADPEGGPVRIRDAAAHIHRGVRYTHSIVQDAEGIIISVAYGCRGAYGSIRRVSDYELELVDTPTPEPRHD